MSRPRLVSFKLCPFAQRSVITLLEKDVEFDISYIDLGNPPDWFKAISPLGKVPLLQVGERVLFESAVINEYLDEANPPRLMPEDALDRAELRAWIEFCSNLLMAQFGMLTAPDEDAMLAKRDEYRHLMELLDEHLGDGPFFAGSAFTLADSSCAPALMRQQLIGHVHDLGVMDGLDKLSALSETLLSRPSVQRSVVEDFDELYHGFIRMKGGFFAQWM